MDVYRATAALDQPTLTAMAERLEIRGQHPFFARMIDRYLNALDLRQIGSVLEIGCGTGVVARHIACRTDFKGHVTGADISPYLIAEAKRLAAEHGLSNRTRFVLADSVAADENAFDAAVIHTVLSHVDDPLAMLHEARRIVRPGGMIAVFDGDFASITFGPKHADRDIVSSVVTNQTVMRDMPRMAKAAGLEIAHFFPEIIAEAGRADFWAPALQAMRTLMPASGQQSRSAADAWADALLQASADNEFFGACCYYSYLLRVPSAH